MVGLVVGLFNVARYERKVCYRETTHARQGGYRGALLGPYLRGAGQHPSGGVTGAGEKVFLISATSEPRKAHWVALIPAGIRNSEGISPCNVASISGKNRICCIYFRK